MNNFFQRLQRSNDKQKFVLTIWVVFSFLLGRSWALNDFDEGMMIIYIPIALLLLGIPALFLYKLWGDKSAEPVTRVQKNKTLVSKKELMKRYEDTGKSSVVLSIIAIILSIGVSLIDYTIEDTLLGVIILFPFLIPFLYFGDKFKKVTIDKLDYALKISRGMLIYTAFFVVANLLLGSIGWLWLFLLYYFYKSYKETKDYISSK